MGWFDLGIDCDCPCDATPCSWQLQVKVERCPPLSRDVGEEPYTFTFDGPGGAHHEVTDWADMWGGAGASIPDPAEGAWTVTVSGTAGTCILSVDVTECESEFRVLHAVHSLAVGCGSNLLEDVDWSVAGLGVGLPSSGTTGEDGAYAFLLCADGDFDVGLAPPSGSHFEAASYTLRKGGLGCPTVVAGEGLGAPEEGYLCGCVDCPWPVKDALLLTTKYGTYPFSYADAAGVGAVIIEDVFDAEARPASACPPGFGNGYGGRYVLESDSGTTTRVTYRITCAPGGGFRVAKSVNILPSFVEDGSGGLTFSGFRMADTGGTPIAAPSWGLARGGTAETEPYECHTVTGVGDMATLEHQERGFLSGPCASPAGALGWHAIPGTGETVSISEAP